MLTEKYYTNFYAPDNADSMEEPGIPDGKGTPKILRIIKVPRTILNQLCRVSKAMKSHNQSNNIGK